MLRRLPVCRLDARNRVPNPHVRAQPATHCACARLPTAGRRPEFPVLGSWGKAMRVALRNKESWGKGAVRLPKILVLTRLGAFRVPHSRWIPSPAGGLAQDWRRRRLRIAVVAHPGTHTHARHALSRCRSWLRLLALAHSCSQQPALRKCGGGASLAVRTQEIHPHKCPGKMTVRKPGLWGLRPRD